MRAKVTINSVEHEIDTHERETLLESCLRAQIKPSYSCLEGMCSFCEAEIEEGDVKTNPGYETKSHPRTVKTCQTFPVSKTVKIKYLKST
ncbi:MAG: 2Fe-2S iron-sulfur cluster binding domain-containing protein [Bdellovibrionaceae bacterium]|nr:2Fe-2S iron-sulfur cluster binding domain-containing protein [Pseudobdellovibrionaceae bacterium]